MHYSSSSLSQTESHWMASLSSIRPVPQTSVGTVSLRRVFFLSVSAFGVLLAALSLLFYTLPPYYDSFFFGLDIAGMHQFQRHFGLEGIHTWPFRRFSRVFRVLVVLIWASYALFVAAALQETKLGTKLAARPLILLVAAVAVIVALFSAPLLSTDAYAYVSHGRLFLLYGQNPYLFGPHTLVHSNDPVAPFLTWDAPTVYGPFWTWIEIAVTALLRHGGVWTQVLAMKLLEAGALLAAALAGRRLTARLMPGKENVTLLAIGLNPMLLLEGPGSGHNDLVCLALLLWGTALFADKKYVAAALYLGLSVSIKPVTLALLPWALLEYWRVEQGRSLRQKLPALALAPLLVLLPLALLFAPLWAGPATIASAQLRTNYMQGAAYIAQAQALHSWFAGHGIGPGLASVLTSLVQNRLLVLLYIALTVWLWKMPRTGGWLLAWAVFSLGVMFLFLKPAFPWYITWFWPIFLLRWDRLSLSLSAGCFFLSLLMTFGYGLLTDVGSHHMRYWIEITPTAHGDYVSFPTKI